MPRSPRESSLPQARPVEFPKIRVYDSNPLQISHSKTGQQRLPSRQTTNSQSPPPGVNDLCNMPWLQQSLQESMHQHVAPTATVNNGHIIHGRLQASTKLDTNVNRNAPYQMQNNTTGVLSQMAVSCNQLPVHTRPTTVYRTPKVTSSTPRDK
jgi:hypothetical protein